MTHAQLRFLGIQDLIIIQIQKVIQELNVIRKIMDKPMVPTDKIRVL